jgi:hypothetical protein
MRSKLALSAIIAFACGCRPAPTNQTLGASLEAEVRGVVIDSSTGSAIRGAQVWAVGEPIGATTDSLGEFRFRHHYGQFTLLTRICGRNNAAQTSVTFSRPLATPVTVRVTRPTGYCAPLLRPAWDVGPQDTTIFVGYVYYSWEGDTFVTCGGKLFSPRWAPGLTGRRSGGGRRHEEGDSVWVRLQARDVDDPSSRGFAGGPPLYVWRILDVQSHGPSDCANRR